MPNFFVNPNSKILLFNMAFLLGAGYQKIVTVTAITKQMFLKPTLKKRETILVSFVGVKNNFTRFGGLKNV